MLCAATAAACCVRPAAGSAPGSPGALDVVAAATEGYSGSDLMELASQVRGG
jgi:hypothetical protein